MENWICLRQNRLKEMKSRIKEELPLFMKIFYCILSSTSRQKRGAISINRQQHYTIADISRQRCKDRGNQRFYNCYSISRKRSSIYCEGDGFCERYSNRHQRISFNHTPVRKRGRTYIHPSYVIQARFTFLHDKNIIVHVSSLDD
jgi:hypothetical protein